MSAYGGSDLNFWGSLDHHSLAARAPAASGDPSIRPWMCSGRPAPGAVPLRVHGHYSRAENEAAFGVLSTESPWIHREGVLWHQASVIDLLFITLRKSDALFSPSTRYRDLALGPALFHWESQSTTTAASPTGQRTIHHATCLAIGNAANAATGRSSLTTASMKTISVARLETMEIITLAALSFRQGMLGRCHFKKNPSQLGKFQGLQYLAL